MKNFRMLMLTAVVSLTGAAIFNSCENTDVTPPTDDSNFAGTYKLNSYKISEDDGTNTGTYVPAQADLNGDTVESNDLTAESTCYGDSYIRFNNDHTYSRYYTYFDGTTCATAVREAGVWNRVDNVITIASSNTNGAPDGQGGMEEYTMDFTFDGSGSISGSREAIDNTIGAGFGTGKVDFTYSKQVAP